MPLTLPGQEDLAAHMNGQNQKSSTRTGSTPSEKIFILDSDPNNYRFSRFHL